MRYSLVAAAMVFALTTTGCATTPSTPTAAPTAEAPSPTPTSEPIADPAPQAPGGITCSDLLSDDEASTLVAESSLTDTALSFRDFQLRQLGGLSCEWTNGLDRPDNNGNPAAFADVTITALPEAEIEWTQYKTQPGSEVSGDRQVNCYLKDNCEANAFIAGWWVTLYAQGPLATRSDAKNTTLVDTALDTIEATLTAAGPGTGDWQAPAETLALGDGCGDVISEVRLAEILGGDVSTVTAYDGGVYFLGNAVDDRLGITPCYWNLAGEDFGGITALPGGAWAADEPSLFSSSKKPVEIPGLVDSDSAFMWCETDYSTTCTLELAVGHNFMSLSAGDYSPTVAKLDPRELVKTIGAAIVENVRS